ncbi:MAG: MerC domain-containing protein [Chlorobiota bacterium]
MKSTSSDKIGIVASVLCLIHCLALPIAFTLSADTLYLVEHEMPIVDYIFAGIALVAAVLSARKTEDPKIKLAFAVGWGLFILGVLFHHHPIMIYLLHLGSLVLIVTHYKNIRNCRVNLKKPDNLK